MMKKNADILIFSEDPGAANCVADLPAALTAFGIVSCMLAAGLAADILKKRGVDCSFCIDPQTDAKALLDSVNPRLIIVGTAENPDTLGLLLIEAARESGIKSVGVVDAHGNAALRFRGRSSDALTYFPDWLCVPSEKTRQVYLSLGCAENRVIACGHPQWRYVRQAVKRLSRKDRNAIRRQIFPGLPDGRSVVTFISEGCARLKPRDGEYFSACTIPVRQGANGRTEIVLDLFLEEIEHFQPRPYLVLRAHPKDLETDYAVYKKHFDSISQHSEALEVLFAADFVVGMTSSLMMEAALMGKPTLAIVPRNDETDILPAIEMGLTPWVESAAQLQKMLPDFLTKSHTAASTESRQKIQEDPLKQITDLIIKLLDKDTKNDRKTVTAASKI